MTMLSYTSFSKIGNDLKQLLGKELLKTQSPYYGTTFRVNRSRVRDAALFLNERGAYFMNLSIIDMEDKFELVYEYFVQMLKEKKYFFIITECDKKANEIDSIEIIYPSAKFLELEISKRYGLKFISFTEDVEEELFTIPADLLPDERVLNLVPIGIFNKIHEDNQYFHIQAENGNMISVVEKTGWLYRGITPLLKHKNAFQENVLLTKRICHPSSFHHCLAYTMGIEQVAKIKVSKRVMLIRMLGCELERFENHLNFLMNSFFLLNLKRVYYKLLYKRNKLFKLYKKYLEITFLDELNFIGYVKDIKSQNITLIHIALENLLSSVNEIINDYLYTNYVRSRCQGIGVLDKSEALDAGVTGPCLRASGIGYDIRKEQPYLLYLDKEISRYWDVVTFKDGDVLRRLEVRLWEMKNSSKIINEILEQLLEDESTIEPLDPTKIKLAGNVLSIVQLENPLGELLYHMKTANRPNKKTLGGIYIATPSLKNFFALNNYILKGNKESDFSLIVHSMDLNFNEIDL